MNINLKINEEKCIHCGMCIKDCPGGVLEFDENKIPAIRPSGQNNCIKCQHCLAICPAGAISVFSKNPDDSEMAGNINPDKLLNLIKTRRSFRQFKSQNVPFEIMDKLKDMLNFVPTGCNSRDFYFNFVEDINVMDEYREYVLAKLKNLIWLLPKKFSNYKKSIQNGDDVIFRNAPHMLIVSINKKAPCKDIDPVIALSYFDLYAQSLGLGTLWCGFADIAFKLFPKLKKSLKLPKDHKIGYIMLFGMPKIKYQRAIQPDNYPFATVSKAGLFN